jgi:ring-1,2-phenylacetyl-CoA epoxidase subunit PaaC
MTGAPAAIADPVTRAAFREWLLRAADDELIIGHRHSEWTGFGPDIESDVALSSIAQEEIGHARAVYAQIVAGEDHDADHLAFARPAGEYRHAIFVERENGGWEQSIVRLALYERYDALRLRALAASDQAPVAALARALLREERYHALFADTWLSRLAQAGSAERERVQAALDAAWPDALGLCERTGADAHLLAAGVLPAPAGDFRDAWEGAVRPVLESWGLTIPSAPARLGGRRGTHTSEFDGLLAQMTEVRQSDPEARW